jgi:membrane-bound lytic murein transglycosylase A
MVAQDTGSAITGPVRGDIYWGTGAHAGAVAGRMNSPGRYFVLLPKPVALQINGLMAK